MLVVASCWGAPWAHHAHARQNCTCCGCQGSIPLWGIWGWGENLHQDSIGIQAILPKQYSSSIEEEALWTQASGNGFLQKTSCSNKEYQADKKHGQLMPLLQVGKGKSGDNDIMDRRQHDSWPRRFGHASQGWSNEAVWMWWLWVTWRIRWEQAWLCGSDAIRFIQTVLLQS